MKCCLCGEEIFEWRSYLPKPVGSGKCCKPCFNQKVAPIRVENVEKERGDLDVWDLMNLIGSWTKAHDFNEHSVEVAWGIDRVGELFQEQGKKVFTWLHLMTESGWKTNLGIGHKNPEIISLEHPKKLDQWSYLYPHCILVTHEGERIKTTEALEKFLAANC